MPGRKVTKGRVFVNKRSQLLPLPKEFQLPVGEVHLSWEGTKLVVSPQPRDWSELLSSQAVAPAEFTRGAKLG